MYLQAVLGVLMVVGAAAAEAPLFEDVHVVPLPVQEYGYRGMPGDMALLDDGRLLLAYSHILPDGKGDGAIACRYSSDQGKTWGEETILVAVPPAPGRYAHPSFVRDGNGGLIMSYIYVACEKPLFGGNYFRRADGNAAAWSDQFIVTPCAGYNIMHNNKLVRLSTGRLIAPIEFELVTTGDDHAGYVSTTFYSDDNAQSWLRAKNEVNLLPVEAQEPHVVELKDGRLMMLMRTYSGCVARAYSEDKGETWSAGEKIKELSLPRPSSALNVQRIPSTGDLVLLRCSDGPMEPYRWRTPLVSILSKDDGQTWEHQRVLMGAPDNDYGYPSLLFLGDMALISYHQRDGLHLLRVGVAWFYGEG